MVSGPQLGILQQLWMMDENMSIVRMINGMGKPKCLLKTCFGATLSTATQMDWPDLNTGLSSENSATNSLGNDMA